MTSSNALPRGQRSVPAAGNQRSAFHEGKSHTRPRPESLHASRMRGVMGPKMSDPFLQCAGAAAVCSALYPSG
jgi:hypothetical protein